MAFGSVAVASVAILTSDKGANEGTEGGHGHAISVAVTTRRVMSRFPFRFAIPSVRPVWAMARAASR